MTSGNINSFVGDLVEMAKAMERLPSVEAENNRLNGEVERYAKQVQDREIAIIAYKEQIDDLHAKVRSLEVERDDASFRVLEAEDQALAALGLVKSARISMESVISILDPPKPEPVKEPETVLPSAQDTFHEPQVQPVATPASGESEASPTGEQQAGSQEETPTLTDWQQDKAETSILSPGQSESSPTVADALTSSSASNTESASSAEPTHGPYFDKRYRDIHGYVSIHDWITGDGLEEDYWSTSSIF